MKAKGIAPQSPAAGAQTAVADSRPALPETLNISLKKAQDLRYGENPHQKAALYGEFGKHFQQLHGKELSYNNIIDLVAASNLTAEFDDPTVAIVKHTSPCGVGSADTLVSAWE